MTEILPTMVGRCLTCSHWNGAKTAEWELIGAAAANGAASKAASLTGGWLGDGTCSEDSVFLEAAVSAGWSGGTAEVWFSASFGCILHAPDPPRVTA